MVVFIQISYIIVVKNVCSLVIHVRMLWQCVHFALMGISYMLAIMNVYRSVMMDIINKEYQDYVLDVIHHA